MDGRCSASVGEEVWQGEVEAAALARPSRLASTRSGGWSWVEFVGTVSLQSVLHTSKHGGRAHTHTHAAHDWLGEPTRGVTGRITGSGLLDAQIS